MPDSPCLRGQRGAILIIALLVLLILTVLGVGGMQSTILEERMAGNLRDRNLAFQAAEAALREAEHVVSGAAIGPFDGTNGLYDEEMAPAPVYPHLEEEWNALSSVRAYSGQIAGVVSAPEYIIEKIHAIPSAGSSLEASAELPDVRLYRVVARAVGQSPGAVVVLRSVYRR